MFAETFITRLIDTRAFALKVESPALDLDSALFSTRRLSPLEYHCYLAIMGADLKRKEARKKKFRGQDCLSLSDAGVQVDLEGTLPEHPPNQKLKQAPRLPVSSGNPVPSIAAEKVTAAKFAVLDESTDQGGESAPQKVQRFVVFIGPYTLSNHT